MRLAVRRVLGRRVGLFIGCLALAGTATLVLGGTGFAAQRFLALSGHLGLGKGTHRFTFAWTDGNTTATFGGRSGKIRFDGVSGPGALSASTVTFVASGKFAGHQFKVPITLSEGSDVFQISGSVGALPIVGKAHTSTNTKTFKSKLQFSGKVGGIPVSGNVPLPVTHGATNTTTGTITIE